MFFIGALAAVFSGERGYGADLSGLYQFKAWLTNDYPQLVEDIYRASLEQVFAQQYHDFAVLEEAVQTRVLTAYQVLQHTQDALGKFNMMPATAQTTSDYWDLSLLAQSAEFAAKELALQQNAYQDMLNYEENLCSDLHLAQVNTYYAPLRSIDFPQFKFDPHGDWINPIHPVVEAQGPGMQLVVPEDLPDAAAEEEGVSKRPGVRWHKMAVGMLTTQLPDLAISAPLAVVGSLAAGIGIALSMHKYKKKIRQYNREIAQAKDLYGQFNTLARAGIEQVDQNSPRIIREVCTLERKKFLDQMSAKYQTAYQPTALADFLQAQRQRTRAAWQTLKLELQRNTENLAQRYQHLASRLASHQDLWIKAAQADLDYSFGRVVRTSRSWALYLKEQVVPQLNSFLAVQKQGEVGQVITARQTLLHQVMLAERFYGPRRASELRERIFPMLQRSLNPRANDRENI